MNELTIQKAKKLADIYRCDVLIGVRPYDKGFFASINSTDLNDRQEYDGSTPEEAIDALYFYTVKKFEDRLAQSTSTAKYAQGVLDQLQ